MSVIKENYFKVLENIAKAAQKRGIDPHDVKIVAVSKRIAREKIEEAIEAGVKILGENRIQEAEQKIPSITGRAEWHMIGHLQTNKARKAVQLFSAIESVDSLKLARKIDQYAAEENVKMNVFLQVDLAEEATKFGIPEDGVRTAAAEIKRLPHLSLQGLMIIPPFFRDPEKARPYFIRLRKMLHRLNEQEKMSITGLSMGMSADYAVAVEEGATHVRVGTAIFGPRP